MVCHNQLYLHSTVVLLKEKTKLIGHWFVQGDLHSTVVLLKVDEQEKQLQANLDLHSTVVLLKVEPTSSKSS